MAEIKCGRWASSHLSMALRPLSIELRNVLSFVTVRYNSIASESSDYEGVLDLMCINGLLCDLISDLYEKNPTTGPLGYALFSCAMNGAMQGVRHL